MTSVAFSLCIEFAHKANTELIQGIESCLKVGGCRGHFPGGIYMWLSDVQTLSCHNFGRLWHHCLNFNQIMSLIVILSASSSFSMVLFHGSVPEAWDIALKGPQKLGKRRFSVIYV